MGKRSALAHVVNRLRPEEQEVARLEATDQLLESAKPFLASILLAKARFS